MIDDSQQHKTLGSNHQTNGVRKAIQISILIHEFIPTCEWNYPTAMLDDQRTFNAHQQDLQGERFGIDADTLQSPEDIKVTQERA